MSVVLDKLGQVGIFEVISSSSDGDITEILGRVPKELADPWVALMRNVLIAALRVKAADSVDFSRYYYVVRKTRQIPVELPNGQTRMKTLQDMEITWNWRVRFDSRGAQFISAECDRILNAAFRRQAAEKGELMIRPAVVTGASVVEVGTGGREPTKVNRL